MRYLAILAAVAGFGAAATADPIRAKNSLAEVADTLAGDIDAYLKGKGETAVILGEVRYTGQGQASSGPLVRLALETALKARGIEVKLKANIRVSADYCENEEKGDDGRQVVTISTEVKQFKPDNKLDLKLAVTNSQAVAVLLGLSVTFPPDANPKARSALTREAADKPKFHKAEKVVLNDAKSPFGVEIRVAPAKPGKTNPDGSRAFEDYTPRAPDNKEGYAFVPIVRDEVYGVVLSNDADFDAAVQLRIDGLSMYSFSDKKFREGGQEDGKPLYTFVIVPKKSKAFIPGWHVTNENTDEFQVTEYAKSAAAELKSTAATGTITATFHAAWNPKDKPPADEPKSPDKNSLSSDATGRGAQVKKTYVEVRKEIGVARDVISVRYAK